MKNRNLYNDTNGGENHNRVDVNVVLSDDIMKFLKGLEKLASDGDEDSNEKECPKCHRKWADTSLRMDVGCEVCYKVFKKEISEAMKNRNLYPMLQKRDEFAALKRDLEVAIRLEEYEKAEEIKKKLEEAAHGNSRI